MIEDLDSDQDREKLADMLFGREMKNGRPSGIGLSCFRVELGGGSADQNDGGIVKEWRETKSFLLENGKYSWSNAEGSDWWLRHNLQAIIGYVNSPPYFMNKNGYTYKTEKRIDANLAESNYRAYAKYLSNVIRYYKSQKVSIDYISPFNEPQWPWVFTVGQAKQEGSPWRNAEIYQVCKEIDKNFRDHRLPTKILIPEAAEIKFLYGRVNGFAKESADQISAFWDENSPSSLVQTKSIAPIVAGHTYFVDHGDDTIIDTRFKLRQKMDEVDPELCFWQTEYSLLNEGFKEGREEIKEITSMDCALFLAKMIHHDFTLARATSWQFWSSIHPKLHGNLPRFNLITATSPQGKLKVAPTKLFWALGHFSRWIRPGMVRHRVWRSDHSKGDGLKQSLLREAQALMLSAYVDRSKKKVVLVAVNYSNKDKKIIIKNKSLKNFKMYVTSAGPQNNMMPKNVSTRGASITIPQRSIVTLVSQ
ncbi:MAG: hypothetical protein HRT88_24050 [Lentisphaeraceae bacterium]|nr:hypothetical protein [Lentisphaeraceae bacterium]